LAEAVNTKRKKHRISVWFFPQQVDKIANFALHIVIVTAVVPKSADGDYLLVLSTRMRQLYSQPLSELQREFSQKRLKCKHFSMWCSGIRKIWILRKIKLYTDTFLLTF
jgi:hypothetical protein